MATKKTAKRRGRTPIEGLTGINLRVVQAQLDEVDRLVESERKARGMAGLSRADLLREIIAKGLATYTAT